MVANQCLQDDTRIMIPITHESYKTHLNIKLFCLPSEPLNKADKLMFVQSVSYLVSVS